MLGESFLEGTWNYSPSEGSASAAESTTVSGTVSMAVLDKSCGAVAGVQEGMRLQSPSFALRASMSVSIWILGMWGEIM